MEALVIQDFLVSTIFLYVFYLIESLWNVHITGLHGPIGETGPIGPPGSIGKDGDIGPKGDQGIKGETGKLGLPGYFFFRFNNFKL